MHAFLDSAISSNDIVYIYTRTFAFLILDENDLGKGTGICGRD